MQETQTSEIIKFEEINGLMMSAPEVLQKNQSLNAKAVAKATALRDTIEGQGMSDELDSELNKWMSSAKDADALLKQRRSPITQIANQLIKAFTSLEHPFDATKKDSFYSVFQVYRNGWAKKKADEQKAKEAEILRRQNIEKEKITLKAEIERQVREAYSHKLYEWKNWVNNVLVNMTLQNFDESRAKLENLTIDYPRDKFLMLPVNVTAIYLHVTESGKLIGDIKESLYQELSANFHENMEDLKQRTIDQLPSKKRELENMAKASAEQKALLEAQAEKRRQEEADKLKAEQEAQQKADAARIEAEKQLQTAGTLFDSAAQLAEVKEDAGKVRQGYNIEVLNPAGWGAIFFFWFEKEGQSMNVADMEKKTFKQLKTFCEKYAHKHGEKIANEAVVYEEEFKAVVTK
ncbi:hypothetical protein [Parapedobacter indicus]|uniref:DUF1351 domain-containing protein n=1 Tax=Parapedobacter indicus TaxID=1477437 RepID=A0A1I3UYQ1_9SPHI|nr:hypothetical protein [Parapedobacter indicus]PPK99035.1 hypothetical protein CLV26_11566 [Parapedobacter indicus]SFJ88032.1 hypothetical protein SAMN05444682_115112 [Parapedobacter indicus]